MKFKAFILSALAVAAFASCGKESGGEPQLPDGQKRVVIKMNFAGGLSRAESNESAVDQTPNFNSLALLFVGNGVVQQVEELTAADQTALESGKPFTVPTSVSKIYAVGNYDATTGTNSPAIPAKNTSEDAIKALALEVNLQQSYKNVNLSAGHAGDEGGEAFGGVGFTGAAGSESASLDIVPAFTRYEIKKVSAAPKEKVEQPLKSFKLTGIYITNTYRTIGLNYAIVPTTESVQFADIFNYGPGTTGFETLVKPYHKDEWDEADVTAATTFTPEAPNTIWHYMMTPPIEGKGTTLVGNTTAESSVPVIVLRIENAIADEDADNEATYSEVSYLTVRKLRPTKAGSEILEFLRPGYVYTMDNISFGGEHLTEKPGETNEKSVTVDVTFKPWVEQGVNPEW